MLKLKLVGTDESQLPIFTATEEDGKEVNVKNWFEKSKSKWHVVLGPNSANRKYIAHNEIMAHLVDDEYVVEDKTTTPRVLGIAQPDKKLVAYMTEEDKAAYEEIIARAIENKKSQVVELTDEEKIAKQISSLQAKLANLKSL